MTDTYRCLACGLHWKEDETGTDPMRARRTCGDAFCAGTVVSFNAELPIGADLQSQRVRQFVEVRRYLLALRDGIDNTEMHCEPLPVTSSWRYVVDQALKATE